MAENSKIGWTDHTFNPWTGCTKVSPGCTRCYAESWGKRSGLAEWGPRGDRRRTTAANWRKPLAWNRAAEAAGRPALVFCASLADVFEGKETMPADALPIVERARTDLWEMVEATPWLIWLMLTKRVENVMQMVPPAWLSALGAWPRNVWIGATAEDQEQADKRIPELLKIPAPVRFLSCEPLIGPVDLDPLWCERHGREHILNEAPGQPWCVECDTEVGGPGWLGIDGINWIIAGGESGHGARVMRVDWYRALMRQAAGAGVPFFGKQMGAIQAGLMELKHPKGEDPEEWPQDLQVRQFPEIGEPA